MTKLQLALDVLTIEDAIRIAEKLADYVDIIEVGSTLAKEESAAETIMVLKRLFPDKIILADFKTMSRGSVEAAMAFDAGADIMTVCGTADNQTIKSAIERANKMKRKVMVDLLGSEDKLKRALEIKKLKPHYICVHVCVEKNTCSLEELKEIKEQVKIPLSVAGHITKNNIKRVLKFNPDIIVVGRGLIEAKNPVKEAEAINKLINRKPSKSKREEKEPVIKIVKVIEEEIKNILNKISTPYTNKFINLLLNAKAEDRKIFVTGEGRSGLVAKAFATNLVHLGFQSYFIGDSINPPVRRGDVLVAVSGSGKTPVIMERVEKAKKYGAVIISITTNNFSGITRDSKFILEIPAMTNSKMEPLGSLFEQSVLLYLDSITVALMAKLGKSPFELRKYYHKI